MSDNQGTTDQASTSATDQASTSTDQSSQGQAPATVKDLPEWAQKEIRDARREAADNRTKLQKIEDRDKTDLQKAIDRATELEKLHGETVTQLQHERAERLVVTAAGKANAVRPDAVYRLIRDDLEFDEDGKAKNIDAAITSARKEYPELFRASAGSGDGGKNGDTPKDKNEAMNQFIRQQAGR
jgi:hypothetical protein